MRELYEEGKLQQAKTKFHKPQNITREINSNGAGDEVIEQIFSFRWMLPID
jgi:hypothetical protein